MVVAGDAALARLFKRKLTGARVVVDAARGMHLALRVDSGVAKDGSAFAECNAAVSELPKRKFLAVLRTRAEVGGEGMDDDELRSAATDECASSLAQDVSKWLRTHR